MEVTKGADFNNKNEHEMKNITTTGTSVSMDRNEEEDKRHIELFQEKEEDIKKEIQIRTKVEFQLGCVKEKTKRLVQIWEELEVLTDPMRKELATMRKKVDTANRELRSLAKSCQKKEKEYREAREVLHHKNNEKNQLTIALVELMKESEKSRMKKLEELSKIIDPSG